MKKVFLFFFFLGIITGGQAQVLSPAALSSSGGSAGIGGAYLDWTLGEAVTETFSIPSSSLTQGFQQPSGPFRVSGMMRYLNASLTPMSHSVSYLQSFAGSTVDSVLTTASGKFYFYHAGAGSYKTKGKSSKPWGGANATDALLILKHFVNIMPLQGLYKKAGDVDNSGALNSLDALLVARRFTGLISSFAAGDWRFSQDTVLVGVVPELQDISALCNGDVNGSYTPAAKTVPNVELIQQGERECCRGMTVTVPVRAGAGFSTGALSLVMAWKRAYFEVSEITFGSKDGILVWNQAEDELRMAWYSTTLAAFREGDVVFSMHLAVRDIAGIDPEHLAPVILEGTEVAGMAGEILPLLHWDIPSFRHIQAAGEPFFACCHPNPIADRISLAFGLTQPARMSLLLSDLTGKIIRDINLGYCPAGASSYELDCSTYPPGLYFLTLRPDNSAHAGTLTRKLVIAR